MPGDFLKGSAPLFLLYSFYSFIRDDFCVWVKFYGPEGGEKL